MIVLDNIIFSLQRIGGISAVWYEHLSRMLKDNLRHSDIMILEGGSAKENIFRQQLQINDNIIKYEPSRMLWAKRYHNPIINLNLDSFIFHSSYYRTCSSRNAINITTVHDFTYEYFTRGIAKVVHCWQKYKAIKNSDRIICVSENTKKDLLRFVPDIDESKIRVIYNGVSEDYYPIRHEHSTDSSFVLFVGARGGYKNFDIAVKAIRDTSLDLVIVGSPLSDTEIKYLDSTLGINRYRYAGRISNKELNELYNSAFCLLYPSSYEGFGIPVIEAQKAGCPVIAANRSSIPEIIGDKTMLINEASPTEILRKLQLLKIDHVRKEIIELGLENAKRFTWEKTYAETIKVYDEAQRRL